MKFSLGWLRELAPVPAEVGVDEIARRLTAAGFHVEGVEEVEGLAVAEGITFGHLKGTLDAFCKRLFSPTTQVRLRPSFFPFTEPSAEVDVTCAACGGSGCPTCSQTGWMEILGCGMVDPRVLRNCGIDPQVYSGFAFGMGLDRITMLKYGIPDLRDMFSADLRWLKHYGFVPLDVPTLAGGLST